MNRVITLLLWSAVWLAGCSKTNQIPAVSGTINGNAALTLYGTSNKATDYVLLSKVAGDNKISYQGTVYSYYFVSSATDIFITISSIATIRATLVTGTPTVLTIVSTPQGVFGSTNYSSR
jgi:precorrin-4 methylase